MVRRYRKQWKPKKNDSAAVAFRWMKLCKNRENERETEQNESFLLSLPFCSQTVATSNLNEPINLFGRKTLLLCKIYRLRDSFVCLFDDRIMFFFVENLHFNRADRWRDRVHRHNEKETKRKEKNKQKECKNT